MHSSNVLDFLGEELAPVSADNPFSYIDGFILAIFAYLPVGGDIRNFHGPHLLPAGRSISQYAGELLAGENSGILQARFESNSEVLEDYRAFCEKIRTNARYKDMVIVDFTFYNCAECQFAAYCVHIGANEYCISFRGTDGTYEGWYENFMLLKEDTQAQLYASKFLKKQMDYYSKGVFYVTGHSKGGNLSSYATIELLQFYENIIKSYNFDGPGFNREYIDMNTRRIKAAEPVMEAVFIENTIVGELLFGQKEIYGEKRYYIRCDDEAKLLWQHLPFTWMMAQGDFQFVNQSHISKFMNDKLDLIVKITPKDSLVDAINEYFKLINRFKGINADTIETEQAVVNFQVKDH